MYLTWHSNPQYGGAPSAFCEVGVQEDFQCNLLSCSWMWLTSFMGHPLFALDWIGLDLFNDDTRPSGHISHPTQVNVSQNCFHSLNNYSSPIILSSLGAS